MYYRRKILLALLQKFGGSLSKMDLQKYMFLFNKEKVEPYYEFIPYHYGCYSFQLNQDLSTLTKYKIVGTSESNLHLLDRANYFLQLKAEDKRLLLNVHDRYSTIKGNDLVKFVYERHPYFAINSKIAESLLNTTKYNEVLRSKPYEDDYSIFSIGYEGKTVEHYTNQLIRANVKMLCDIRKNPISMKYGFSKNQLKFIVENIGIKYLHFPELGIDSNKRKNLNSQDSYEELFRDFEENTLPLRSRCFEELTKIFLQEKRIAFTCFEANYKQCHRSRVLIIMSEKVGKEYTVTHL